MQQSHPGSLDFPTQALKGLGKIRSGMTVRGNHSSSKTPVNSNPDEKFQGKMKALILSPLTWLYHQRP